VGVSEVNENVLSPQDVRKILDSDNMEIVRLCRKAEVSPRKTDDGKTYFSLDDVRALKQVKETLAPVGAQTTSPNTSQLVVDSLLKSLHKMENNITDSVSKILDERLEGMDEVVVELIRCKTENENLKNQIEDLNKENYNLKKENASYKPFVFGLYVKEEVQKSLF
jgi:FtsZ-binding cell division protein ZapB